MKELYDMRNPEDCDQLLVDLFLGSKYLSIEEARKIINGD